MAKKKITRKELLKTQDEFLTFSSKAAIFFTTHLRELKYAGFAIALLIIAYLGINTYMRYVNKKGQNAYNVACASLSENLTPDGIPGDITESEKLFDRVIDGYGLSRAAKLALPQLANIKYIQKKYDEAILLYRKFSEKRRGERGYASMTSLAVAACYEQKGELKESIKCLISVAASPDDPFREAAMWSLARLYRLDGQEKEEKKVLEEFVTKFKDSPFLPMAKARLK